MLDLQSDKSDRVKILDYKTYNKIPHLSKSRLGEGDHFIDKKSESILLEDIGDNRRLVIVQEKLDGSNVCVVRKDGELYALGRSGFDCKDSNQLQHRMFHTYVKTNQHLFDALLPNDGDRIVGEWLALAHGTVYTNIISPFRPFDLFLNETKAIGETNNIRQLPFIEYFERITRCGFYSPYLVHIGGSCSLRRALKILDNNFPYQDNEGLIFRLEENKVVKFMAKYVKHDKVDGLFLHGREEKDYIWNWR